MRRLLGGKRGRGGGRVHWKRNLSKTVVVLTFLIAIPALAWYSAVPLTRMTGEFNRWAGETLYGS